MCKDHSKPGNGGGYELDFVYSYSCRMTEPNGIGASGYLHIYTREEYHFIILFLERLFSLPAWSLIQSTDILVD